MDCYIFSLVFWFLCRQFHLFSPRSITALSRCKFQGTASMTWPFPRRGLRHFFHGRKRDGELSRYLYLNLFLYLYLYLIIYKSDIYLYTYIYMFLYLYIYISLYVYICIYISIHLVARENPSGDLQWVDAVTSLIGQDLYRIHQLRWQGAVGAVRSSYGPEDTPDFFASTEDLRME